MNLADALDHFQENALRIFEARQDYNESRAEEIEQRAAELFRKFALTSDGNTCPRAFDEAIGDLCIRPGFMAEVARLKDAGKTEAIGLMFSEWFDTYWDRRCRELAEEVLDTEAEKMAEACMAEALL